MGSTPLFVTIGVVAGVEIGSTYTGFIELEIGSTYTGFIGVGYIVVVVTTGYISSTFDLIVFTFPTVTAIG